MFRTPAIGLLIVSASLLGCGVGNIVTSTSGTMTISGIVHGGQQPVANSVIQVYTAGSGGLGSASTPMLTKTVTTDTQGNFNISSDYSCGNSSSGTAIPSGSNQVYLVATGGNPGLASGTDNRALILMAAIGDCSKLSTATFIEINEVTTAAAAWAIAPFIASSSQIGATGTNPDGIANAFLDAGLLADTSTGLPATLPSNLTVETGKLYALANSIASCVNSDGTTGCNKLFAAATPAKGVAPTDTLTAALNIVRHPGQNVVAVYNAGSAAPPFPTTLTKAPNDWTMSLTVTGGGLVMPTTLAVDGQSNIWVANQAGPLSAFSPQGAPLSSTGFGQGSIAQVDAITVDSVGDIWVTNFNGGSGSGSVTEFHGSTAGTPGSIIGTYTTDISFPDALSADTNGDMFVVNTGTSSATVLNQTGGLVSGNLGSGGGFDAVDPQAIAVDTNHGFWLSDGDGSVAHIASTGSILSYNVCCNVDGGIATDANGNVWVADFHGGSDFAGSFDQLLASPNPTLDGTSLIDDAVCGGINHPAFVVVDAAQNVWFSNMFAGSVTEVAANSAAQATNNCSTLALSPTTGVYGTGGYGLDTLLDEPYGIGVDRTGNLWVSDRANNGGYHVVMFFGIAAPTATPVRPTPLAP